MCRHPDRRQLTRRAAPRRPPRRGLVSRHGDAERIGDGAGRLRQGAQIAVGASAPRIDRVVASLSDGLRIPPADAARLPITGTAAQAAERFAAYADAGATWLVLGTIGDDWHTQWKLIAEAATLLERADDARGLSASTGQASVTTARRPQKRQPSRAYPGRLLAGPGSRPAAAAWRGGRLPGERAFHGATTVSCAPVGSGATLM
jgi:hypothetical protein